MGKTQTKPHDETKIDKHIVCNCCTYCLSNEEDITLPYDLETHIPSRTNTNQQTLHFFLFNIGTYSPEVRNIQRRKAKLNITLPKVDNFDVKQKMA